VDGDGEREGHRVERWAGVVTKVAGLLAAITYGVARVATGEYYRPLGLTPEDVGIGQARLVAVTGTLVGILAAFIGVGIASGVLAFQVTRRAVAVPDAGRAPYRLRAFAVPLAVAASPFVALGLVRSWSDDGTASRWLMRSILVVTAGVWASTATPHGVSPRHRLAAFLRAAVAFAVVLAYAAHQTHASATLLVWSVLAALGVLAAYQHDSAEWRQVQGCIPPFLLLVAAGLAAKLSSGALAFWLAPTVSGATIGVLAGRSGISEVARDARQALPKVFPGGAPRLGVMVVLLSLVVVGVLAYGVIQAASADGNYLLSTGKARGLFSDQVFPARVMLRHPRQDPLGICASDRPATILGHGDHAAFVWLGPLPATTTEVDGPVIVPLPDDDYVVTTGFGQSGACVLTS
jgi:hypothetical protein